MARELSADELQALLGAYALDAVSDDERVQVERYLARSPRARAEVADLRETAAFLAHAGADAPPGLWDRIAGALDEVSPTPEAGARTVVPMSRLRSRPTWRARATAGVAAAAAVVAISVLAVQVVHQDDRIDDLEASGEDGVLAAAEAARRDPDARSATLRSADGTASAEIVYLPDGSGFLVEDDLDPLMPRRTYQLWAMVGDGETTRAISAGVLGPDPGVTAFSFYGPLVGFGVTEEDAPGVESTDNTPVVEGSIDTEDRS